MDAMKQHQQAGEINGDEEEMEIVTERKDEVCGWMEDRFMDRQYYFIYIVMLTPIPATKMQTYCECGDVVSSTFHANRKGGPDILLQ